MFANLQALVTLVSSDNQATDAEKSAVLSAIQGGCPRPDPAVRAEVVSFADAARILGYKSARGVYRALHDGALEGFYGGRRQRRCTGITMQSINRALNKTEAFA